MDWQSIGEIIIGVLVFVERAIVYAIKLLRYMLHKPKLNKQQKEILKKAKQELIKGGVCNNG